MKRKTQLILLFSIAAMIIYLSVSLGGPDRENLQKANKALRHYGFLMTSGQKDGETLASKVLPEGVIIQIHIRDRRYDLKYSYFVFAYKPYKYKRENREELTKFFDALTEAVEYYIETEEYPEENPWNELNIFNNPKL